MTKYYCFAYNFGYEQLMMMTKYYRFAYKFWYEQLIMMTKYYVLLKYDNYPHGDLDNCNM